MIVDSLDIMKQHVATIAAVDKFELLQSYVEAAERWAKNELLGADLFDFVEAHKTNSDQRELLVRVQRVIALNGFNRAVPFLDVVQTNNGFAVTDAEGLVPASKERVASLRAGLQAETDEAVEELLRFLEETAAYHDDWKGSPTYTLLTDTFLPTYTLFKRYAPYSKAINLTYPKSRLDFAQLNGKLREVMADKIRGTLGAEFMDELLEQLRDDDLPAENNQLMENIRFALGMYAIGLIPQGDNFMAKVTDILKKAPEDYPTWRNSSEGKAILSPPIPHSDTPIFFAF